MGKNPRTDKAYVQKQQASKSKSTSKGSNKSRGTHVERPPLNDDGLEWGDYAYTASDF